MSFRSADRTYSARRVVRTAERTIPWAIRYVSARYPPYTSANSTSPRVIPSSASLYPKALTSSFNTLIAQSECANPTASGSAKAIATCARSDPKIRRSEHPSSERVR